MFCLEYFLSFFKLNHFICSRSSTIYNPFLYAWLNDNFRKEFRLILPCLFKSTRCWCKSFGNEDGIDDECDNGLNNDNDRFESARLMTVGPASNIQAKLAKKQTLISSSAATSMTIGSTNQNNHNNHHTVKIFDENPKELLKSEHSNNSNNLNSIELNQ